MPSTRTRQHYLRVFSCYLCTPVSNPKLDEHDMISKTCALDAVEQRNKLCRNAKKLLCGMCFSSISQNLESGSTHLKSNVINGRCRHEPTVIPLSTTCRTEDGNRGFYASVHLHLRSLTEETHIDKALFQSLLSTMAFILFPFIFVLLSDFSASRPVPCSHSGHLHFANSEEVDTHPLLGSTPALTADWCLHSFLKLLFPPDFAHVLFVSRPSIFLAKLNRVSDANHTVDHSAEHPQAATFSFPLQPSFGFRGNTRFLLIATLHVLPDRG